MESPDYVSLKTKVQELAKGPADRIAVESNLTKLSLHGFPSKSLNLSEKIAQRELILDRVQKKAEEYEQVGQNCAKGAPLAVMEEFGFGDIKMIKGLSAMPGVALTGQTCGAVLGGLFALGAYFGSDDPLNYKANYLCILKSREFIARFTKQLGTTKCREIHEDVVFGRFHETADRENGYPAFLKDNGFEKCGLPPGISARIVAQILFEHLENEQSA